MSAGLPPALDDTRFKELVYQIRLARRDRAKNRLPRLHVIEVGELEYLDFRLHADPGQISFVPDGTGVALQFEGIKMERVPQESHFAVR